MSEDSICLKQYINEEDYKKLNELKDVCTANEDIFLKLELDFKINMSRTHAGESKECVNEFFYYSGDTLAGYLGICSFSGETGELTGMVHPQCRRKGIFTRLYNLALEECKRRSFKKILLVCDRRSSSGLEFIKAAGAPYSFSEYEMKMEGNYTPEPDGSIVLRKAVNSDADEIARQDCIYFGDTGRTVVLPEEEEKRNTFTYIIELNSAIYGKIRLDINDGEGFICGFGILPGYREKGYGRQALKNALYILSKNNIHTVGLEVAAQNKNALSLYTSCGFKEESVTDYYEAK